MVLNFLENQNVRVLYQTTDHAPLRVVRTGTPEAGRRRILTHLPSWAATVLRLIEGGWP